MQLQKLQSYIRLKSIHHLDRADASRSCLSTCSMHFRRRDRSTAFAHAKYSAYTCVHEVAADIHCCLQLMPSYWLCLHSQICDGMLPSNGYVACCLASQMQPA